MDWLSNDMGFLVVMLVLFIFSFFTIRKTMPKTFFDIQDMLTSHTFWVHFGIVVVVSIAVYIKLKIYEKKDDTDNENYKRLKNALKSAIVALFIAFFAKFDLIFVPFYFIFIAVYFIDAD